MKKRTLKKIYYLFLFIFVCIISIVIFLFVDNRFTPTLKEVSHMHCKAYANKIIDTSLSEIISEQEQKNEPFLFYDTYENGYAANALQINRFCSALSERITNSISELPHEKIMIPFGAIFSSGLLADKGPAITFTLYPAGSVKTNYDSAFVSAGINQVNYKIWLDISMELKIVNPFYKENLLMNRRILLADMIFNGKIPEHYFQMTSPANIY